MYKIFRLNNISVMCSGLSDVPGEAMVKLYCPRCMDVYTPKSSRHHHTDGAFFGTGFPHMVFMVHPEYRAKRPASQFVPRFGDCFILSLSFLFIAFLYKSPLRMTSVSHTFENIFYLKACFHWSSILNSAQQFCLLDRPWHWAHAFRLVQ